jgi:hypothetical protein
MLTVRSFMRVLKASQIRTTRATAPSQTAGPDVVRPSPAIREAILRVEGEYREMPGLNLTLPQTARLLGLDHRTCERVLAILIDRRVLKQAWNGTYVRRQSAGKS